FERDFAATVARAIGSEIMERAAGLGGALHRTGRTASPPEDTQPTDPALSTPAAAEVRGAIERRTDAESVREAFLHFLATGTLPWWFRLPAGRSLEEAISASWRPRGLSQQEGRALLGAITTA